MIRSRNLVLVAALAVTLFFQAPVRAANVWLSLNLQFNTPGNVNSGGTWTTVAKAQPQGIAGVSMNLANTTFGSFLAPSQLDVQLQSGNTTLRNVLVGDSLTPPYPLGIGVIGSSFPSTYVDPAGLVPFGGNPNYGSFTGGVALATGTFAAGVVPNWTGVTDANLFTGASPAPVVDADTLLTVRWVVPEPATFGLGGMALVALVAASRRKSS
ncbi:PEP-CTERM sorting domain-containing protein [Lacipirellula sp.]|uniref:PEP-CTERM sorting domain-containing protein n=1 Tax=Lacipirellula sp. TaxID=2691419 RepID=UPI003D09E512